jgi:hypothetical protein
MQLGAPMKQIPPDKIAGLLELKQRLGLPDARLATAKSSVTKSKSGGKQLGVQCHTAIPDYDSSTLDSLVANITEQVIRFLGE